jgi:hypothetical protein
MVLEWRGVDIFSIMDQDNNARAGWSNRPRTVRLRSSIEQEIVEVSRAAARHSRFIADYLDSLDETTTTINRGGVGSDGPADVSGMSPMPEPIEIPRSSTAALAKVVEFLEHFETSPISLMEPDAGDIANTFEAVVPQTYYRRYVETMRPPELFWHVRMLSNYMEIEQLNILVNVYLAFQIYYDGAPEEGRIAEILQIPAMTEAQLQDARATQSWMFEDDGPLVGSVVAPNNNSNNAGGLGEP